MNAQLCREICGNGTFSATPRQSRPELTLQSFARAMHQMNLSWPVTHPRGKAEQAARVCMCRIATERIDARTNDSVPAVQIHITAARTILLNHLPRRATRLTAN